MNMEENKNITIITENVENVENNAPQPTLASSGEKEISFAGLIALIISKKKPILIWTCVSIVLGVVYALSLPKQYEASISMMPELSGAGRLGGLAAMVGVSLDQSDDAYTTDVYPDIVQSIPFIVDLFDVPVQTTESDTTMTLRQYIINGQKRPWWSPIIKSLKPKKKPKGPVKKSTDEVVDPFYMNSLETELYEGIAGCIATDVDLKTSLIKISVQLQDPLVCAQLCDTVAARLQEYIIDYRTAKARHDLDYALQINEEAEKQYYDAQAAFADYQDANQGLATYRATTTADRLENEMQLAFNLYNTTSQQVQSAQARVQEVTPIFAVVDPSTVPLEPEGPSRKLIVIVFTFLGFFISTCCCLYPYFLGDSIKQALGEDKNGDTNRDERKSTRRWWHRFVRKNADGSDDDDDDNPQQNRTYNLE